VTPYYERDGITIYHADCRDVLPDLSLDRFVLLTDPPYGINGGRGHEARAFIKGAYRSSGWQDNETYVREVCAPIVEQIVARAIRGAVTPGTRWLSLYPQAADLGCFWCPASTTHGNWGMTVFAPILYYGRDFRAGKGAWPTGRQVTERSEANGHPCPKPERAGEWLASKIAQPDDLLLDPFLGSGTTTRVAKNLGMRAVGIEIEERYCEIAAKRLAQDILFKRIVQVSPGLVVEEV